MKKILIIDDESHIALMLKKMLISDKYEIDLATDGIDGLRKFREMQADLVITDIIMPDKEGLETIRELRQINPDIKIIAMSGGGKVSADSYLDAARLFGAAVVISKPFTKKEMVSAVQKLLGG